MRRVELKIIAIVILALALGWSCSLYWYPPPPPKSTYSIEYLSAPGCSTFARIQGKVIWDSTGEPLPYAAIGISGTTRSTRADSLGKYLLDSLVPGTYNIFCSYQPWSPAEAKNIEAEAGKIIIINFILRYDPDFWKGIPGP